MLTWFKVTMVLALSSSVSFPLEVKVRRRGRVVIVVVRDWRRRRGVLMVVVMRGIARWEKWSFKWPTSG